MIERLLLFRQESWRGQLHPKALAAAGGGMLLPAAIGLALLLLLELVAPPAVALAAAAAVAVAAGWLLAGRSAALAGAGAALCLAAGAAAGHLSWEYLTLGLALVATLTVLSHLAAGGLVRGDRYQDQERRLRELTLLLEAAQALSSSLDSDRILKEALRATSRGLHAAHASFHRVSGDAVHISHVQDEAAAQMSSFEYPLARNQAARAAIRTARAAFVRPDHLSGGLLELAEKRGWRVLLMAPVYSDRVLMGLLAAALTSTGAVEPHELRTLEILARMTSLALGNAESLQHERHQAARPEASDRMPPELLGQLAQELSRLRQPSAGPPAAEGLAELDRLVARLDAHAAVDWRTGLPLREVGLAALERDVARSHGTVLGRHTVAFLSLRLSAKMEAGELLAAVAGRLRTGLRSEDMVFLYGPGELVCSFPDTNPSGAWRILNGIRSELERELGWQPFRAGVAHLQDGQSAVHLVDAARAALAPDRAASKPA